MFSPEQYLFTHGGWVSASELVAACDLKDKRELRGENSPIRHCAISGDLGYRHFDHATDEEIQHFCDRMKEHPIAELRRRQFILKKFREREARRKNGDLFQVQAN